MQKCLKYYVSLFTEASIVTTMHTLPNVFCEHLNKIFKRVYCVMFLLRVCSSIMGPPHEDLTISSVA